jgi:hypothetical protein
MTGMLRSYLLFLASAVLFTWLLQGAHDAGYAAALVLACLVWSWSGNRWGNLGEKKEWIRKYGSLELGPCARCGTVTRPTKKMWCGEC